MPPNNLSASLRPAAIAIGVSSTRPHTSPKAYIFAAEVFWYLSTVMKLLVWGSDDVVVLVPLAVSTPTEARFNSAVRAYRPVAASKQSKPDRD